MAGLSRILQVKHSASSPAKSGNNFLFREGLNCAVCHLHRHLMCLSWPAGGWGRSGGAPGDQGVFDCSRSRHGCSDAERLESGNQLRAGCKAALERQFRRPADPGFPGVG